MDKKKSLQNMLVEKWNSVLETSGGIKNQSIKKATAMMLENQFRYLNGGEEMVTEATHTDYSLTQGNPYMPAQGSHDPSSRGSGVFANIAIPMVRRTFPNLVAHEIVGVQPMNQPIGLAFAIRYKAGQTYNGVGPDAAEYGQELGGYNVDPYYSGNQSTSAAYDTQDGEALGSKAGSGVGDDIGLGIGTGEHIKEVGMTLEKDKVEARTRKLRARWSIEVAQDVKAMHGLDLEDEMMDVLSYEITAEIDRELVGVLRAKAKENPNSAFGANKLDWTLLDGRWEQEKYRNLYNYLSRKSNTIAISTKRGPGNFVVASPNICSAFEASSAFIVAPVDSDIDTSITGVARVGSLDGRMSVYRDNFQTTDNFVLGYKGNSQYDTGIVYLPYVQLMQQRATYEDSFQPSVGLLSRYAIHHHLWGAEKYYVYVEVDKMFQAG